MRVADILTRPGLPCLKQLRSPVCGMAHGARLWSGALGAVMLLGSGSALAQQQTQEPSAAPPASSSTAQQGAAEDFGLDLDENMDVGVAWPDLDAEQPDALAPPPVADAGTQPLQPDSGPAIVMDDAEPGAVAGREPVDVAADESGLIADDGSEHRYRIEINGLDGITDGLFRDRFRNLSLLEQGRGKPANLAQINRRMRLDAELLERILRAKGYYDAIIRPSVRPPAEVGDSKLRVLFNIRPGARYSLSHVLLPGLSIASTRVPALRDAFPVKVGDPVDADAIVAGRNKLAIALGNNGFPFASVDEPELTVDHEAQHGDLEMVVHAGGYRLFGDIVIDQTGRKLFSPRHLQRISRFDRGDVYNVSDVEDLRRAIIATGLISSASVEPRDGTDGEHVDLAVALTPGKMRTVAGEIGYGTGEGYRVEASWQHRNFFPPEGAITVRGSLGTKEQAAGVAYRRNNFLRRDNILSAGLAARHQVFDAYTAKTATLSFGLERQTNILYQKKWAWSIGTEFIVSREDDLFGTATTSSQRDYFIAALPASLTYDASDDLLNPTRGFRLGARVSPEATLQGGSKYGYVKAQVDGSVYLPASDAVVVAARMRLGSTFGGIAATRIAPSRRFYAGGGASVRGYGYQAIGPRDINNDPLGGKSLAEFSLETRVRLGTFGLVPFVDAGNISTGFLPSVHNFRYGAGVGLRYYSNFGPIRIDVGTPLNRQPGDSRIAVYVSLGQAF